MRSVHFAILIQSPPSRLEGCTGAYAFSNPGDDLDVRSARYAFRYCNAIHVGNAFTRIREDSSVHRSALVCRIQDPRVRLAVLVIVSLLKNLSDP